MKVTYRPIENYPGKRSGDTKSSPFRTNWDDTLMLLAYEIDRLGGNEVVLQLDLTDAEIRMDGMPRKDARPRTSAVVISFQSRHGPLQFATDRFDRWHDNLYAIARGLEALRKIDRYGISTGAQQYTGWKSIGSGIEMPAHQMTYEEAHNFITLHGESGDLKTAYRNAARYLHPDNHDTGDAEKFKRLQEAKRVVAL